MTLTLRIENYDTLDDGGPTWIVLEARGASVGRRASNDWVLPDPAKHISGHHFDITFHDGAYWLTDVSTNGTFIEGQRHRLEAPQRLAGGERLVVGHYVISVTISTPSFAAQPPLVDTGHTWSAPPTDEADPWDFGGPSTPVDPLPVRRNAHHMDDVAKDYVPLQRPQMPGAAMPGTAPQSPPVPRSAQPVTMPPTFGAGGPPPSSPPSLQMPVGQMPPAYGTPPPPPVPAPSMTPPEPQPVQLGQVAPTPTAPPAAGHPAGAGPDALAFAQAFCAGAGLDPALAARRDPQELAHDLGRAVRIATDEVMRMLQDRANVKHFTKGGERTMRSATGNNPMKFLPDSDQALEALFLSPRDGFMTGPDGFDNALKDLRAHQMGVFAALQPALAAVLEGLSPEEIEAEETTGNLLSTSRRGKNWDSFVKRWDAKAQSGEHGMLDAFMLAFARAYAEATVRNSGL